jgi:hypothetical protein
MGRKTASVVAIMALILAAPLAYFVITRFLVHQSAVTNIANQAVSSMPELSPAAVNVFHKLQGQQMPWLVSVGLLAELAPEQVRMAEWHARGAVWKQLLPLRLSDAELLALYVHYMPFDGGRGVEFASRKYFGKLASELTVEDAVGLVIISSHPNTSPDANAKRYSQAHERLMAKYRTAG